MLQQTSDAGGAFQQGRDRLVVVESMGDIIRSVKEQYGLKSGLFDMEATAICQAAEMFDLPVVVIKMVSDVPEEGDDEFSYDAFVDAHTDFSAFVDYLEELR